jgi:hypothetical protein
LNEIFAKSNVAACPVAPKETTTSVKETDLANYIGQSVKVRSKVYGHKDFGSMVLVNMGAAYPDALFTIVLRGEAKVLGDNLDGKTISVTGKVSDYRGKPEIEVRDKNQIIE